MENKNDDIEKIKEIMFGLPNNIVLKIIQNNINLKQYKIKKEAIDTFSRCLSIFILYITDTALEHCEHDKRSTIQTKDILNALDDSLFIDIVEEIKQLNKNEQNDIDIQNI